MDPYLEGSEWVGAHIELSAEIARQLAPQVRPRYVVRTMRRFVTDAGDAGSIALADMYPDVSIAAGGAPGLWSAQHETATAPPALLAPPLKLKTVMPERVPLRSPDPDVVLDLQAAFTAVYDGLGYDLSVDYRHPPEVRLPDSAGAGAAERLRAAGLPAR